MKVYNSFAALAIANGTPENSLPNCIKIPEGINSGCVTDVQNMVKQNVQGNPEESDSPSTVGAVDAGRVATIAKQLSACISHPENYSPEQKKSIQTQFIKGLDHIPGNVKKARLDQAQKMASGKQNSAGLAAKEKKEMDTALAEIDRVIQLSGITDDYYTGWRQHDLATAEQ